MDASSLRVLILSLDAECMSALQGVSDVHYIEQTLDLERLREEPLVPPPDLILSGPSLGVTSLNEIAQSLRMTYQEIPIHFVTAVRKDFDRKIFKKNGFTDAFLLPLEATLLEGQIKDLNTRKNGAKTKTYKSVKLVDITPGEVLPFDTFIYLPANKKHIKISQSGEPLDELRVKKLNQHQLSSLHIDQEQMPEFYKFTALQLKKLQGSNTLSATEKQEKMESSIRDMMGTLFNDSIKEASTTHGKSIVNDCQEIVKAYVLEAGDKRDWYQRIMAMSDSNGNLFSHAANVSTLAALFSMGLGIGKPDELAIAGILHDIGLADIPAAIQMKSIEGRSKEEQEIYQSHVELSIKMIRDKKLVISETVFKIVQQHHEQWDGQGYPHGLAGKRLHESAQLLSLADDFEYATRVVEGKRRCTPYEAVMAMREQGRKNPGAEKYDPLLIERLLKLFPAEPAQAVAS